VDNTVCGTKVEEVDEVVVLETVGVLEDMVDDDEVVVEEEVVGGVEAEDCWVEVATVSGVVEVEVLVMAGAELVGGARYLLVH
jgi:hypothetical protein